MRLSGFQDEIAKLFDLHARLERQLQLASLDDDVRVIEHVRLQRVEHTFSRHDDLFRLLFDRERANQGRDFFCCLPLGQLRETFLPSPHARVNDLQKELTGARVEDENSAVDWLCHQVTLECFVNRHAVHIRIVHEPNCLVAEQLAVVLRVEIRFGGLRGVQLQTLTNALAQYVKRRISFHDLRHCLLHQRFAPREPVTVG